jgi:hypothetical protein
MECVRVCEGEKIKENTSEVFYEENLMRLLNVIILPNALTADEKRYFGKTTLT